MNAISGWWPSWGRYKSTLRWPGSESAPEELIDTNTNHLASSGYQNYARQRYFFIGQCFKWKYFRSNTRLTKKYQILETVIKWKDRVRVSSYLFHPGVDLLVRRMYKIVSFFILFYERLHSETNPIRMSISSALSLLSFSQIHKISMFISIRAQIRLCK